ncbi:hypothetical protein PENTCL1PPCAC_20465, partial [Pristionchus entomophagus]
MEILALPDLFLRKLMRTMEIDYRMRLRLVSRAFEKLVADTHAGYFADGSIHTYLDYNTIDESDPNSRAAEMIIICFGDKSFTFVAKPEILSQFLHLRNRLFSGISFGAFGFKLIVDSIPIDFTRQIVKQFKIGHLRLHLNTETHLENSRKLIADFPRSTYTMYLQQFMPEVEQLLSLPPMKEMHMVVPRTPSISAATFFQLITAHKLLHIYRESVAINWQELKHAMQMISCDARERTARVIVRNDSMVGWLRSEGLSESTEPRTICRGFELIANRTPQQSAEDDHDND